MTYEVEIAVQAERDLRGIYEYIANELQSPQAAAAQFSRLEENICALDQMPDRYRRYDREPWHGRGWRILPVDHYCVFYMHDHDRKVVYITRVLYGGRDIENVLAECEGS
ncbi:MAG: type II toxin-antitoxin system RelE/ParE family toxin [Acutalibacter sp.]|jgi:toxin ParE1/3/4|uniref:type II toxin-antitoxin system RelE/ParE family toxin n=1 Tax=Acutalibacter sp. TaxID=1918636 RepID=UPI00216D86EB|nr:type II toxin-antitoxin system RelE/ParE family toxin [Acutalibacter sp.]MCI9225663.1 type II toxin-antitoxin system RelE/ParE family toxin [Acutalibacter sp.]